MEVVILNFLPVLWAKCPLNRQCSSVSQPFSQTLKDKCYQQSLCSGLQLLELLKPTRYKPDPVDQLARETNFTKEEVKSLYRAFKQECPTGISDEETFKGETD